MSAFWLVGSSRGKRTLTVMATATARQAETEGAEKGQVSAFRSMMQGYALAKRMNMPGARNTAMRVAIP